MAAEMFGGIPLRRALFMVAALSVSTTPSFSQPFSVSFSTNADRETTTFDGRSIVHDVYGFGYSERQKAEVHDLDLAGIRTEIAADRSVAAVLFNCRNSSRCVQLSRAFSTSTRTPGVTDSDRADSMSMRCTPSDCAKFVGAVRSSASLAGFAAAPTTVECEGLRTIYSAGGNIALPEKCLQPGDRASIYQPSNPATPQGTASKPVATTPPTKTDPPAVDKPARTLTPEEIDKAKEIIKNDPDKLQEYLKKVLGEQGASSRNDPNVQRGTDVQRIPDQIDFAPPYFGPDLCDPSDGFCKPQAPVIPVEQVGLDGKRIPSEINFGPSIVGTSWSVDLGTIGGGSLDVTFASGGSATAVYGSVEQKGAWQLRGRLFEIYLPLKGQIPSAQRPAWCATQLTIRGRFSTDKSMEGKFSLSGPSCDDFWGGKSVLEGTARGVMK